MIRFLSEDSERTQSRQSTAILLLLLIMGSVIGAFAAGRFFQYHSDSYDLRAVYLLAKNVHFFRFLILSALFSVLLFTVGFSRRAYLIYSLLFCKGFAVGYFFWLTGIVLRQGGPRPIAFLLLVLCVLPLPVYLFTASFLLQIPRRKSTQIGNFLIFLHLAAIGLVLLVRAIFL